MEKKIVLNAMKIEIYTSALSTDLRQAKVMGIFKILVLREEN